VRAKPRAEWTESPRGVLQPEEASAQSLSTPKKWGEGWSALRKEPQERNQVLPTTHTKSPSLRKAMDGFLIFGKCGF
jgi:hypothetical protein